MADYMTRNEARLRTCPFTMNGAQATEMDFSGSRCQAEKCMAWEWLGPLLCDDDMDEKIGRCVAFK